MKKIFTLLFTFLTSITFITAQCDHIFRMNDAFGDDVINSYIKLRSTEIKEFDNVEKFDKSKPITKWERQNTLDC